MLIAPQLFDDMMQAMLEPKGFIQAAIIWKKYDVSQEMHGENLTAMKLKQV